MSGPERTADGRYVVVDGRRWRATDPGIPEPLRSDLVGELMAARRAVGAADGTADEEAAESRARTRVQDAKVALGERGHPWWEPADDEVVQARLAAAVRALVRRRDTEVDLADVAAVLDGVDAATAPADLVHDVAADLVADGDVAWSGDDTVVAG